jgi:hypothetical protein
LIADPDPSRSFAAQTIEINFLFDLFALQDPFESGLLEAL